VPWPTTDRSAMDGFALGAGPDGARPGDRFHVVGEALAGHPFDGEVRRGEAVRIMTGAVVPRGADLVVKVEDTSGFDGQEVEVKAAAARGAHIRPLGSEIAVGDLLLRAGTRVRAAEVGALAVLGIAAVPVVRRPRVAVLSTGDEVVEVERVPRPHEVRDSNSWALSAQVLECGGEPLRLGIVRDDQVQLRRQLERGLDEADVLLTIGGVSKGTHDLVHDTLRELGVAEVFHGIAVKPGKPAFFGERADPRRFVFGLPGNPASCSTVFDLLVRPLLARLGGGVEAPPLHAALAGAPFRRNERLQAIPARLCAGGDAVLTAELAPGRPSGDPFGLCAGDGYALIPAGAEPAATPRAEVVPYGGPHLGARR